MSDYEQHNLGGEKRNAPIWQVFGIVLVLMSVSVGSFMLGKKHPAPGNSYNFSSASYTSDSSSSSDGSQTVDNSGGGDVITQQTQYVTLQNLVGYGSSSVEQAVRSWGLRIFTRYTNGDPSISARLNNGCTVVDQSPAAGSDLPLGSTVTILADCPMTGNY